MRIIHMLDSPSAWKSGIWYHRTHVPGNGLEARGHSTKQIAIGQEIPDEFMEYPNTVIFGRIYPEYTDPIDHMKKYKKQGTRVLYDIDDDYWAVDPTNPSRFVSNVFKDQYEGMMEECDAIITPSEILGKKIQKLKKNKKVFICHNSINFEHYKERPHERDMFEEERKKKIEYLNEAVKKLEIDEKLFPKFNDLFGKVLPKDNVLRIGYMGAASHWADLEIVVGVLEKLYEKYDFHFIIQGMVGEPLEAAIYYHNRLLDSNLQPEKNDYYKSSLAFYQKLKKLDITHIPFYPPELHPSVLSRADFDIGIAPLQDTEFNRGKSNIKFYEYASVGTVTLASDVEPYRSEVNYRAKNTFQDWYDKLEKLIVDEKYRKYLLKTQQDWVKEHRSIEKVAIDWELACQKPSKEGAPKVLNQDKSFLAKFKKKWQK
jgi:hypothetical protein